jgi:hypothetical protein
MKTDRVGPRRIGHDLLIDHVNLASERTTMCSAEYMQALYRMQALCRRNVYQPVRSPTTECVARETRNRIGTLTGFCTLLTSCRSDVSFHIATRFHHMIGYSMSVPF